MKNTIVLIFAILGIAKAESSFSQRAELNLQFKEKTLKQIFNKIEKATDFSFIYDESTLDINKLINITEKPKSIESLLDNILDETNCTYKIQGRQIIIFKKEVVVNPKNGAKSNQQEKRFTVRGRVFENKEPPVPLPGVSIIIKNTNRGTISDVDGYFFIEVPEDEILVFSFLGHISEEVLITRNYQELIISLDENIQNLEEVVIIGFFEELKQNSVSSISQLDVSSNLANKPVTQISQALQGGITGITVTQPNGMPGADVADIRIRGISTLGNSNPLVLVDGFPMDMNNLNPATIESITVLKDAAAAAIYGARSANGVIAIKTKRGEVGNMKVGFSSYYGIQEPTYFPDFVDAPTYMRMINKAIINQDAGDPRYTQEEIQIAADGSAPLNYPNTDWKKELLKNGSISSHSAYMSGGNTLARFALNVNYLGQKGFLDKVSSDRLTLRANTTITISPKIFINLDFNAYRTSRTEPLGSLPNRNSWEYLHRIYTLPPTMGTKYPDKGDGIDYYYRSTLGAFPHTNPVMLIEKGGDTEWLQDNVSINIQPKWIIKPNLNFNTQFSYRITSNTNRIQRDAFNFFDYFTGELIRPLDQIRDVSLTRSSYYYIGGTFDYTVKKGNHRLHTILGGNQELSNSGSWDQWAMVSTYGKFNYTCNSRYVIEGTVRLDGSSRFGPGNKFGIFPSIGLGWNVHEESFFSMFDHWVSIFKLRTSYGQLGNENIGLYRYQTLIDANNGVETVFGNPNITWETVNMLNIGVKAVLFKDKIELIFDWYDKITKDIILEPPISYTGGTSEIPVNVGEVRNRGWEASIDYKQSWGDFNFNLHTGLSYNKNEILTLLGGPYDNNRNIHKEGFPINAHYRYISDGLLQIDDFKGQDNNGNWIPVEGVVTLGRQGPGDIHYLDLDGDDAITTGDRQVTGKPFPDYNYFANLSFFYKNFDFVTLLQGIAGIDAYYFRFLMNPIHEIDARTPMKVQTDYWTPENTDARYPRLLLDASVNNYDSDYWIYNSSYLRIKYIQLGYNINNKLTRKARISKLRLFLNLQNFFTISEQSIIDPETMGTVRTYPIAKTTSVGLDVNF